MKTPGIAILTPWRVLKAVRRLKGKVDLIVVSLHTDLEFSDDPDPARIGLCRALTGAGADIVLCHHPHVPQGVEVHNQSVIFYGLGNCVFPVHGNPYMQESSSHTGHSFAAKVSFDKKGVTDYELFPFRIDKRHRPVPLTDPKRHEFLAHIDELSGRLKDPIAVSRRWSLHCRSFLTCHLIVQYYQLRKGELKGIARFLRYLPHRIIRRAIVGFFYYLSHPESHHSANIRG